MKMPQREVNQAKLDAWVTRFAIYRRQPTKEDILAWLRLFKKSDRDFAIRILENLLLISEPAIHDGFRDGLGKVPDWNGNAKQRKGNWYFCGYANKAHESGAVMLRMFAEANRLTRSSQEHMFVTPRDLPQLKLTGHDTVVFVDDVSGSGIQVVHYWETIKELVASDAKTVLILTVATEAAIEKIENETELKVFAHRVVGHKGNIFHDDCKILTPKEKMRLLKYCKLADNQRPKGFNDCGLLLILSHKTPNNTIPVLHAHHNGWQGLFPRFLPIEAAEG